MLIEDAQDGGKTAPAPPGRDFAARSTKDISFVELHYASGRGACSSIVNGIGNVCVITLTVTDSAGQSDSDTMRMVFVDQTPD